MFVKQFRSTWVRVPDPLRPGRRALEERLIASGATSISHASGNYKADGAGWFEVPADVGAELLRVSARDPQTGAVSRFYTPAEVNEQVRLGAAQDDAESKPPRRTRTSSS